MEAEGAKGKGGRERGRQMRASNCKNEQKWWRDNRAWFCGANFAYTTCRKACFELLQGRWAYPTGGVHLTEKNYFKTLRPWRHDRSGHHLRLAKDRLREIADVGIEGEVCTHDQALRQQQAQKLRIPNAWKILDFFVFIVESRNNMSKLSTLRSFLMQKPFNFLRDPLLPTITNKYSMLFHSSADQMISILFRPCSSFDAPRLGNSLTWRYKRCRRCPRQRPGQRRTSANLPAALRCPQWWAPQRYLQIALLSVHPRRLTWNIIMQVWKVIFLFK